MAEILDRLRELLLIKLALLGQRNERRVNRVLGIDLEVTPQGGPRVAAAEAVGAQSQIRPRNPRTDLIGDEPDIVADGNEGPRKSGEHLVQVACRGFSV